jgi:hypothetical protein
MAPEGSVTRPLMPPRPAWPKVAATQKESSRAQKAFRAVEIPRFRFVMAIS